MRLLQVLTLIVAAAMVCGCRDRAVLPASLVDTNREIYQVRGVIKEIKPDGKTAVIAHEEIPGYMKAMTMDFEVKQKAELSGLKAGDRIAFNLVVTTNDAWIENARKLAPENTNPGVVGTVGSTNGGSVGPLNFRKSPVVEPLDVGDLVPDYKLTNHLGEPIHFAQFRGSALGITFLFTRCPLPTYCPRMSGNFAAAAHALATAPGAPTNWMLLSISFDPEWDTPARLASYAKSYTPDTNHWQFATSDFWNLDGLTEQLGLQFWKQDGSINHNLRTAVFDTRGRLQKVFIGNEWKVEDFVAEMTKAAQVK